MNEEGPRNATGGERVDNDWSVSMVAWGKPSNPKTFSSFASRLMSALGRSEHLRAEFDSKQLGPLDLFRGAVTPTRRSLNPLSLAVSRATP